LERLALVAGRIDGVEADQLLQQGDRISTELGGDGGGF
jgi:hypothetical protein